MVDEAPASRPPGLPASALSGSLLPAVPPPGALGVLSPGGGCPDTRQGSSSQVEPLPRDRFSEPGCTFPEAAATRQKRKSATAAKVQLLTLSSGAVRAGIQLPGSLPPTPSPHPRLLIKRRAAESERLVEDVSSG